MTSNPWNHYWEIAEALEEAYPDADRLNLSDEELFKMIKELPQYKGIERPKNELLYQAVMTSWFNLDEGAESDERYPVSPAS